MNKIKSLEGGVIIFASLIIIMDYLQNFKRILDATIKENASDLLISVGHHPKLRITGQLVPLAHEDKITPDIAEGLAYSLMDEAMKNKL